VVPKQLYHFKVEVSLSEDTLAAAEEHWANTVFRNGICVSVIFPVAKMLFILDK